MKKRVTVTPSIPVHSLAKPIIDPVVSVELPIGDIETAIYSGAFVHQHLEDGTIVELNVNNYKEVFETTEVKPEPEVEVAPPVQPEPVPNTAPVLKGISSLTLTVGDTFDKMAGVTATDEEDGDITNKIVVTGNVNTAVAGSYSIKYEVVDSGGLTATKNRSITVNAVVIEENTPEEPESRMIGEQPKVVEVSENEYLNKKKKK